MNPCHVCGLDLAGYDVEYHYSRNHNMGGEHIPWGVLLISLRETNRLLGEYIKIAQGTNGAQSSASESTQSTR